MQPVLPDATAPLDSPHAVWDFVASLDMWVMRMGLDRIQAVLKDLGNPQDQVQVVHLVGTNGKGSTSAMLASIYGAAGYKTGLFTSPHLVHVQERIQVNGHPVPDSVLVQAANRVRQAIRQVLDEPLTYFEFLTALAFVCFETAGVDIALIEAGLGGRLDSTNVMTCPLATVVTPISLDHQDRLGHTREAIAREKAAVFRPGVPVVVAPQAPEVLAVIETTATQRHAPVIMGDAARVTLGAIAQDAQGRFLREVSEGDATYELGLLGRYQQQNLAVVLTLVRVLAGVLPVPEPALQQGLRNVSWPGRFQMFGARRLVVDGSHNEAGVAALLETLTSDFAQVPIDWGLALLANRNPEVLKPLLAYPQTRSVLWLVGGEPASFHPPEDLIQAASAWSCPASAQSVVPLDAFIQAPPCGEALRVVTGSLYQAGEALQFLNL